MTLDALKAALALPDAKECVHCDLDEYGHTPDCGALRDAEVTIWAAAPALIAVAEAVGEFHTALYAYQNALEAGRPVDMIQIVTDHDRTRDAMFVALATLHNNDASNSGGAV